MRLSALLTGSLAAALAAAAMALPAVATPQPANIVATPLTASGNGALTLTPAATYETGTFDESAAEIVAYHAGTGRLFVVNAEAGEVDVLAVAEDLTITKVGTISVPGQANSVAVRADGLGVIAVEAPTKTDAGSLAFFDAAAATPSVLGTVTVGAQPDMVTISEDGAYAVVAGEGEPSDDFTVDPEGTVGVVTLPTSVTAPGQDAVRIADFHAYEAGGSATLPDDVLIYGPTPETDYPVSRNLEPEYVTVTGGTAYVTLQENNAMAAVDLASATVTDIWALGLKDNGVAGNGLDASDKDDAINIATYSGLTSAYMPDGVAAYTAGGTTYLVTANEGDAREWGEYEAAARVKDLGDDGLAPVWDSSALAFQTDDDALGRLNVLVDQGLSEDGTCYESLVALGGRSFTIWTADGTLVFDSGDDFEQTIAAANPNYFNSNHTESASDKRSDDKGPEPENLTLGEVDGRTYAFIGLERDSGIMVYDVTDPAGAAFVTYVNNRDFTVSAEDDGLRGAGDLGPEGLTFIAASDSPTGQPLLAVGNEVSGTTTLWEIGVPQEDTAVIDVVSINDFHGRIAASGESAGAAVLAGAVASFRDANPNTLFLSAGDNIGASTFVSAVAQDQPTLDVLNAMNLDVSAFGNHEFDQGADDVTGRVVGASDFSYVAANIYKDGARLFDAYAIEEVDGVRVGVIGAITEEMSSLVSPAGVEGIEWRDMGEEVNAVAAELTDGQESNGEADVLLVLVHDGAGSSESDAITAGTPYGDLVYGIDDSVSAIISGHTHQSYVHEIDGVTVIQSAQYGELLGHLQITYDRATGAADVVVAENVDLVTDDGAVYAADPWVARLVSEAETHASELGAVNIGALDTGIARAVQSDGTSENRGGESTAGNWVSDVYKWAAEQNGYDVDIAFMNPGGVRADMQAGDVTYEEAAVVQPFANTITFKEYTGAQIRAILEQQWQPEGASRPFLRLGASAGFRYVYDSTAPAGQRIGTMWLNGVELQDDLTYGVVTNSFLMAGGDAFTGFTAGGAAQDTGSVDLAATVDYFKSFGDTAVQPSLTQRALGVTWVSSATATYRPGDTIEIDTSSWSFTQGAPQAESLTVTLGGLELGTATLDHSVTDKYDEQGSATIAAVIPADAVIQEAASSGQDGGFAAGGALALDAAVQPRAVAAKTIVATDGVAQLVISDGLGTEISLPVSVASAAADDDGDGESQDGTGTQGEEDAQGDSAGRDELSTTGVSGLGALTALATLALAAGGALVGRRRRAL